MYLVILAPSLLVSVLKKNRPYQPFYFEDIPKWRRPLKRLTFREMLEIMRSEIIYNPDILYQIHIYPLEIACLLKYAA
jgi:hypothetical protein